MSTTPATTSNATDSNNVPVPKQQQTLSDAMRVHNFTVQQAKNSNNIMNYQNEGKTKFEQKILKDSQIVSDAVKDAGLHYNKFLYPTLIIIPLIILFLIILVTSISGITKIFIFLLILFIIIIYCCQMRNVNIVSYFNGKRSAVYNNEPSAPPEEIVVSSN